MRMEAEASHRSLSGREALGLANREASDGQGRPSAGAAASTGHQGMVASKFHISAFLPSCMEDMQSLSAQDQARKLKAQTFLRSKAAAIGGLQCLMQMLGL